MKIEKNNHHIISKKLLLLFHSYDKKEIVGHFELHISLCKKEIIIQTNQKGRLADQISEKIKDMIIAEYAPGDKLPVENDLAKKFSVSRITIREAIAKLKVLGIVDVRQGDGTFVRKLSPSSVITPIVPMLQLTNVDVTEIFEVRILLEKKAAADAAVNATESEIKDLRIILDTMNQAAMENDISLFNDFDVQFHLQIAKCSHNQVICTIHQMLLGMIQQTIKKACAVTEHMIKSIILHNRILQAIIDHDPEKASEYMNTHLGDGLEFVRKTEALEKAMKKKE